MPEALSEGVRLGVGVELYVSVGEREWEEVREPENVWVGDLEKDEEGEVEGVWVRLEVVVHVGASVRVPDGLRETLREMDPADSDTEVGVGDGLLVGKVGVRDVLGDSEAEGREAEGDSDRVTLGLGEGGVGLCEAVEVRV